MSNNPLNIIFKVVSYQIDNPRYILHRQTGKRFFVRHDYHAMPDKIGQRKEYAELFLTKWNKRIGKADLIYTRTFEGREKLLHARMGAMSSKFIPAAERKSIWK